MSGRMTIAAPSTPSRCWPTRSRLWHEIIYRDPATDQIVAKSRRLAGNVLIWEAGDVTYRLEGAKTVADARAVARNLKAP